MKNSILLLVCIAVLNSILGWSQGLQFQKSYGSALRNVGTAIPTQDSGYIVSGTNTDINNWTGPGFLTKLDKYGDTVWFHTYASPSSDIMPAVAMETSDGGFIVSVYNRTIGACKVMKVNASGDTLWTRPSSYCPEWESFYPDASGNYYYATGGMALMKLDTLFNLIWARVVPDASRGTGGIQVPGGFVFWGETRTLASGNLNYEDLYMVKVDTAGKFLWGRTYGTSHAIEYAGNIQRTFDGGFIAIGYGDGFGIGSTDIILIKTDSMGVIQWTKAYGGPGGDNGYYVEQTLGTAGYAFMGLTHGFESTPSQKSYRAFVTRTDINGSPIWGRIYGDIANNPVNAEDIAFTIFETKDFGFVLSGSTQTMGAGDYDVWVVKTDANGLSGCREIINYPNTIVPSLIQGAGGYDSVLTATSSPFSLSQANFPLMVSVACSTIPLSVGEAEGVENAITLYPNPLIPSSASRITIRSSLHIMEILMLDLTGRKLFSGEVDSVDDDFTLKIQDLPGGVYIVKILTSQGPVLKKLVVN